MIDLHPEMSYDVRFRRFLDKYHPNLFDHPELVLQLEPAKGRELLSGLIELACQCAHIRNIKLGRAGIWALPTSWVLNNIESVAEQMLQDNNEWEYRRLLEVYWHIDKSLARKFALHCLEHHDPEIQGVGKECLEKLSDPVDSQKNDYWE